MKSISKVMNFFGLNRSIVGLLGIVILVGMGERMAERFLPIYMLALGGGFLSIGFLNGLTNLLGALYSFPGGYLSDHIGTKKALLVFNLMAMAGYLVVIFIPMWYAVIIGAFFFLSWSAISLPASMSIVANVLPKNKRTMGVTMHSLVRRIPMATGPLLGGFFICSYGEINGIRLAFVSAFILAIVAIILQQKMLQDEPPPKDKDSVKAERNPIRTLKYMTSDLRNLLISDILVRFSEQIPYAFVVVWCLKNIASPVNAFQFGVLTSIEMITAVLIYIPVAYLADRGNKKPFVVMTFVFFSLFPLALFHCKSFWPLVGAFVLRGLKEFGEPTRKALIMDLAPEGRKAAVFGLYYLIRDSIVSVAAFLGAFLWSYSPSVNLKVAFFCGCLGTIWFILKGKDLSQSN